MASLPQNGDLQGLVIVSPDAHLQTVRHRLESLRD